MLSIDKTAAWSRRGLHLLAWSTAGSVAMAILEGVVRGPVAYAHNAPAAAAMFAAWCFGLRGVGETLMSAGALVFVAGKFLETRTTFSVGFSDARNVLSKGPDEDNVVWVGHRYASRLEAEAAAGAIESRIKAA